jgi:hypothetical protein
MPTAIEFCRFQILPHRREIFAEGRPMELGEASARDAWGLVLRGLVRPIAATARSAE